MKLVILLLRHFFKTFIRNVYWFTRILAIKKGKRFQCEFPLIVEGRGKIIVGSNVDMKARVNIGCGNNASLIFGNGCTLGGFLYLRAGGNAAVKFGDNVHLEGHTTMYMSNEWQIGDQVFIASGCAIFAREPGWDGVFKIGNGTRIGNNALIDLSENVIIGNCVAIGPNCVIYTHDHDYRENKDIPWKGQPIRKPVIIEDGVWVGSGVTILPGVKIGKGAIVAAGSVVTKDVENNQLVGGVPAKIIRNG